MYKRQRLNFVAEIATSGGGHRLKGFLMLKTSCEKLLKSVGNNVVLISSAMGRIE